MFSVVVRILAKQTLLTAFSIATRLNEIDSITSVYWVKFQNKKNRSCLQVIFNVYRRLLCSRGNRISASFCLFFLLRLSLVHYFSPYLCHTVLHVCTRTSLKCTCKSPSSLPDVHNVKEYATFQRDKVSYLHFITTGPVIKEVSPEKGTEHVGQTSDVSGASAASPAASPFTSRSALCVSNGKEEDVAQLSGKNFCVDIGDISVAMDDADSDVELPTFDLVSSLGI